VAVRGVVAVDGKTLRRSLDRAAEQGPIHMISAWSSQQRLVLGQCKVADKSNEIPAIPELLRLLELRGAVVTCDAMGCQREIGARIVDQEVDYVLGLKGNQGTLHKDVALFFDERQDGFAGHQVTVHESSEKGHGRLETRRVVATEDIAWLQQDHGWPGLCSIVKVESRRELLVEDKVETETRYYISSLPADTEQIGHAIRSHRGVENGLHWVMDMVFRDARAAYGAGTRRRTSPPSSTWQAISCVVARGNTACAPVVTSLPGMRTFSTRCSLLE